MGNLRATSGQPGGLGPLDLVAGVGLVLLLSGLLVLGLTTRTPRGSDPAFAPARAAKPSIRPLASSSPPGSYGQKVQTPPVTSSSVPPGSSVPAVTGPVTAVGDSIMLDTQAALEADIPGVQVNGLVSRQFDAGVAVIQSEEAAGTLGKVLVVELGTNGSVTPEAFDSMMQAASGVPRVVFVNVCVPRPWEEEDNAVLAAGVARYPGKAVLADWYSLASGHPEWFAPDLVHLNAAGATALAALIARSA